MSEAARRTSTERGRRCAAPIVASLFACCFSVSLAACNARPPAVPAEPAADVASDEPATTAAAEEPSAALASEAATATEEAASTEATPTTEPTPEATAEATPEVTATPLSETAPETDAPPPSDEPVKTRATDLERIGELARKRARLSASGASTVGPGDLVKVTVTDVPELNLEARVGTDGRILLPLIGAIEVTGRSEAELAAAISKELVDKRYVRSPRVAVFIAEPKSQQVAVTGAVAKPGLFPLTRNRSTIIDMLSEAGGLAKDAGEVVQFVPAAEANPAIPGVIPDMQGAIQIDVNDLFRGRNRTVLNLPVVSGDVIFVPEAGSFTINGWIEKPGTYPLTRRTAVLAAIASAGGPLFPARLQKVEILREGETSGDRPTLTYLNVKEVEAGRLPDMTLRAGDVVRVPAWPHLLPPWAVYSIVRNLISISAGIPIF